MATLIFAGIGAMMAGASAATPVFLGLTGAQLGMMAGATIGSLVDSMWMSAAFAQTSHSEGPRLDDRRVQLASEGSPMNYCLGPENKVAGVVIWLDDLDEHKHENSSGGGKGMGGGGGSYTSYTYSLNLAVGVCEGPVSGIKKIWADEKLVYDRDSGGADKKRVESINIYLGTSTQTPDPLIQMLEGSANVPAFRNTVYVVLKNLQLADFGNRCPQFTFLVEESVGTSVASALGAILERYGLDASQYDVSAVPGCLRGYAWSGLTSGTGVLSALINTYSLRVQENNGKLTFFGRGSEPVINVSESDLAATDSNNIVDQLKITDADEMTLPKEVNITFLDPDNDYQRGAQSARRQFAPSQSSTSLDAPLVMSAYQAFILAKQSLWIAWCERQTFELTLPPSYMAVQESDLLAVPFKGNNYPIRVTEVNRGANYLLQVKGVFQDKDLYGISASADSNYRPGPGIGFNPPLDVVVLDIPALSSGELTEPGVYVAACNRQDYDSWSGLVIVSSTNADGPYSFAGKVSNQTVIGITSTALKSHGCTMWDVKSTLDVTVDHGTLESATELEVLNGANHLLVGGEIIGFTTATLLDTDKYRLSGFIRGRRGTEWATGSHGPNDTMVLLNSSLAWVPVSAAQLGRVKYAKALPPGSDETAYDPVAYAASGRNMVTLAPVGITARLMANGDIKIRWCYRSRRPMNVLVSRTVNDDPARCRLTLYAGSTTYMDLDVDGTEYTWKVADQGTFTPDHTLGIDISQYSAQFGLGKMATVALYV